MQTGDADPAATGEKLTEAFKAQDWKASLAVLEGMRNDGLPPTTVLCNKAISCLCSHGQLERASTLFDQMRGLSPKQVALNEPVLCTRLK
jgi:pentatricopeptide repeat protein